MVQTHSTEFEIQTYKNNTYEITLVEQTGKATNDVADKLEIVTYMGLISRAASRMAFADPTTCASDIADDTTR
jgi:hypothetical protein